MGLDMYLHCNSKKVCQEVNDMTDEWEKNQAFRGIAIYWRKSNAIHKWFVDNVQEGNDDCGTYEVDVNELARLHDACKEVLESTELVNAKVEDGQTLIDGVWVPNMVDGQKLADTTKAEELLPTQEGFFFGGTSYDQWYWWDLQYTMAKLDALMENLMPSDASQWYVVHKDEPDWAVRFHYHSSW